MRLACVELGQAQKKAGAMRRVLCRLRECESGKALAGSLLLDSLLGRVGMDWGWKVGVGGFGVVRLDMGGKARFCESEARARLTRLLQRFKKRLASNKSEAGGNRAPNRSYFFVDAFQCAFFYQRGNRFKLPFYPRNCLCR